MNRSTFQLWNIAMMSCKYHGIIMSHINGILTVYLIDCLGEQQGKYQSSTLVAFCEGSPAVNYSHKGPVIPKVFPCHDIVIWVRSWNCGCLVTWFCYQLIAKPGIKTAAVPWPDPYIGTELVSWFKIRMRQGQSTFPIECWGVGDFCGPGHWCVVFCMLSCVFSGA